MVYYSVASVDRSTACDEYSLSLNPNFTITNAVLSIKICAACSCDVGSEELKAGYNIFTI